MHAYQVINPLGKALGGLRKFIANPKVGGMLVVLCLFWPQTGNCEAYSKVHTGLQAVSDSELDDMRGGFSIGSANFNFTFRSLTWVNNVLQAETELTFANNVISSVKNLSNLMVSNGVKTPGVSTGNLPLSSLSTLIKLGPGNSGITGNALANSTALSTVIQNNVSNALIQHLTQINGVVNNMGATTHTASMVIRMNQVSSMGSIISRF